MSYESEILRKLRLIEWLKAEVITHVGQLYQAMAQNSAKAIEEALAAIIISCYVLGKRLGVDYSALDEVISARLGQNIKTEQEVEKWFGDLSALQRYLRQKR